MKPAKTSGVNDRSAISAAEKMELSKETFSPELCVQQIKNIAY